MIPAISLTAKHNFCWDFYASTAEASIGNDYVDLEMEDFTMARACLRGASILTVLNRVVGHIFVVSFGKKVMMTRGGISGVCVRNGQSGDELVCLYGFPMPFLLRP